jgi:phospholipase/lecithinase/hemolysin
LQFASSDVSAKFNALFPSVIAAGQSFGMNVSFLDMSALMTNVFNDALFNGGANYGITNVYTPCAPFPGNIGTSCNVSLFSDALHPSARGHELLGAAALAVVPVPGALWLFSSASFILMVLRRRAR